MDMFDIVFFRTGTMVLFAASLLDKPKRTIPGSTSILIASLIGISIVNLFIHTFSPTVLHTSMNLFLGIVGFCIVYAYWDDKQSLKKVILLAALINLCLFIFQKIGINPVFDKMPYKGQEGAFLGNQPRLMTYFALVTPLLNLWLLPLSLILGLFTKQYVIFIPIAVCLIIRSKSFKNRVYIGVLAVLSMAVAYKHIWSSLSFRFNLSWLPALKLFFERPLIGYGLGVGPVPGIEVLGNSYLQFIIGVGIIGLVWFGYAIKTCRKQILSSAALLSLLLIMSIEYPIEITRLWYLIMAIVVMALIKGEVKNA